MIKYFSLQNNQLTLLNEDTKSAAIWLCLEQPSDTEISTVAETFSFPSDYITDVLDDTENSRFEKLAQETFADPALLLVQYPFAKLSPAGYLQIETYPFSIILTPDGKMITASNYEPEFIKKILQKKFSDSANSNAIWEILFQMFWEMSASFNILLASMKTHSDTLENQIQVATENKQLSQIMNIQKSLIYFEQATMDNQHVFQKFFETNLLGWDATGHGQMHDILVENRQAQISARLQLKLVEKMNETFSSIVSNNLNNVMKILTSLTIVLTIPTIIGSIYGMNIQLPFANRDDAFWWLFLGTFILCILVVYYLRKNRFL